MRQLIVDSRASTHMTSKGDVNLVEIVKCRKSKDSSEIIAAKVVLGVVVVSIL